MTLKLNLLDFLSGLLTSSVVIRTASIAAVCHTDKSQVFNKALFVNVESFTWNAAFGPLQDYGLALLDCGDASCSGCCLKDHMCAWVCDTECWLTEYSMYLSTVGGFWKTVRVSATEGKFLLIGGVLTRLQCHSILFVVHTTSELFPMKQLRRFDNSLLLASCPPQH